MSGRDDLLIVVSQWVDKAENDLDNAEHTLTRGEDGPLDTVCFHAQQCVEKYVKAVLTLEEIPFPTSHDIGMVASLLPEPTVLSLTPAEMRRLTHYATVTRYPGDYDPISFDEARAAVEIARRACACLRRLIPGEILSK